MNINQQQLHKAMFVILYKQDRVQMITHPRPMELCTVDTPL